MPLSDESIYSREVDRFLKFPKDIIEPTENTE